METNYYEPTRVRSALVALGGLHDCQSDLVVWSVSLWEKGLRARIKSMDVESDLEANIWRRDPLGALAESLPYGLLKEGARAYEKEVPSLNEITGSGAAGIAWSRSWGFWLREAGVYADDLFRSGAVQIQCESFTLEGELGVAVYRRDGYRTSRSYRLSVPTADHVG